VPTGVGGRVIGPLGLAEGAAETGVVGGIDGADEAPGPADALVTGEALAGASVVVGLDTGAAPHPVRKATATAMVTARRPYFSMASSVYLGPVATTARARPDRDVGVVTDSQLRAR